jgi:hypothetical protein
MHFSLRNGVTRFDKAKLKSVWFGQSYQNNIAGFLTGVVLRQIEFWVNGTIAVRLDDHHSRIQDLTHLKHWFTVNEVGVFSHVAYRRNNTRNHQGLLLSHHSAFSMFIDSVCANFGSIGDFC